MELTGTIIAALPAHGGVSSSGNQWQSQTFVLDYADGNYSNKLAFVLGNQRLADYGPTCVIGARVTVAFNVISREYNGKWYTNANAYRVAPAQQATQPAAQAAQMAEPAPNYPQPYPQLAQPSYAPQNPATAYARAATASAPPQQMPVPQVGNLPY